MIEIRQDPRNNENLFYDKKNDRLYSRIVAGLMLPSEKPGFLCVLAEEVVTWPPRDPPLHLLHEHEDTNTDDFLIHAVSLGRKFVVSAYVSRLSTPHSLILIEWNTRAYEEHRRSLSVTPPLNADNSGLIEYHIQVLLRHLRPSAKTLHLGKQSRLPSLLMQLPSTEVGKAKDLDYPGPAALAYGVSFLSGTAPETRPRQQVANHKYDILDMGG